MKPYTVLVGPSRSGHAILHTCPLCKSDVERTWRRPVDRFASRFVPVHRFQCQTFSCRWEGNFRSGVEASQANANMPVDTWTAIRPAVFALEGLMVAALAALVMVFPVTEWFSGPGEYSANSEVANPFDHAKQLAAGRLQVSGTQPVPVVHSTSVGR